jgi:perosamine synthetase
MAGSLGTMGCFSFHAVKNIACGDGGMITTNDEELYKKLISSRWFGINKSTFDRAKDENLKMSYGWEYEIEQLGYKMHMNDLIATLGIEQLKKLESSNERRRNIAAIYNTELADQEWLATPVISDQVVSAQHIYHIRTESRNELNIFLKEKGIATGVHYKPMYKFKYFSGNIQEKCQEYCPVAEKEWLKLLSLPCYPSLTELEQAYIIAQIKDFGRKYNAVV